MHLVCVTTSRADYSHLRLPLLTLAKCPGLKLSVVATAAHLSPQFGNSATEIERDGFSVFAVPCLLAGDDDQSIATSIGLATIGMAQAFAQLQPDVVMLIADRYELMAPATAAMAMRIPIIHLEGGEVSEGAVDDCVRNALTKMAHIHLTPHLQARNRVLAMGEESWRVHVVGAPSLDHLSRFKLMEKSALENVLGARLDPAPILVAYHPVTLDDDPAQESRIFFEALEAINQPVWFCFPNADHRHQQLIQSARSFSSARHHSHIFVNLNPHTYFSLLGHAQVLLGNSSSGIMEAASFDLPCVNVGRRQQGRLKAPNVIDCPAEKDAILIAVKKAMSAGFRHRIKGLVNPYGDGTASERIAEIVQNLPDRAALLHKKSLHPPTDCWRA